MNMYVIVGQLYYYIDIVLESKPLELLQEEGYRLVDKELKELENKGDILVIL